MDSFSETFTFLWLCFTKFLAMILTLSVINSAAKSEITMAQVNVIPKPAKVDPGTGSFHITSETTLSCSDAPLLATACDALRLKPAPASTTAAIRLVQNTARTDLGDEGYELKISSDEIVVEAARRGTFLCDPNFEAIAP
jgi:hypothetical protein